MFTRVYLSVMQVMRSCPALACSRLAAGSALVKKTPLRDPGLVLSRYLNIGRGEQEHLVGDSLDAPAQSEDQPCREVDQTLGVTIDHLGQVHDYRSALTEVLSDRTCLIVRARMQGCDPRQIGRLHLADRGPTADPAARGTLGQLRILALIVLDQLGAVFVVVIGELVLVLILEVVVVLNQPEIDRH